MKLLLALLLQSQSDSKPFKAQLTLESGSFREDATEAGKARLWVRPGEALRYEDGVRRIVIRDGRVKSLKNGERIVRCWDAGRADRFLPVDLWRMSPAEAARRFEVLDDGVPEAPSLPEAVLDREGRPRPVLRLTRLPWARVAGGGEDRAEGCGRVILVPREAALREHWSALRLSVERGSGRILRITARGPLGESVWTLDGCDEVESLEDGLFELEGPGLKTEES